LPSTFAAHWSWEALTRSYRYSSTSTMLHWCHFHAFLRRRYFTFLQVKLLNIKSHKIILDCEAHNMNLNPMRSKKDKLSILLFLTSLPSSILFLSYQSGIGIFWKCKDIRLLNMVPESSIFNAINKSYKKSYFSCRLESVDPQYPNCQQPSVCGILNCNSSHRDTFRHLQECITGYNSTSLGPSKNDFCMLLCTNFTETERWIIFQSELMKYNR